ncbi:four helix bundle protein [Pedobacter montanisoli]|uniref:Four helix bundle protein n=1 Tax=Pedobacter montanisoli TaxID=2923277 RepID=A0ABS9ZZT5_9SPHI|nr:four helix bundle protein [Pedobacter montanisoli]MCJ0743826.1 four helix bundle protein [Pedobacter montanisoli]
MDKNYLQLNQIKAYTNAFHLSNLIWNLISSWDNFSKYSIGQQFVNAVDSISANIAEGFGRYHKKDKIKFYYYSLGSIKECLDWNEKAKVRKLINEEDYIKIFDTLSALPKEVYSLIKFTNEKLKV